MYVNWRKIPSDKVIIMKQEEEVYINRTQIFSICVQAASVFISMYSIRADLSVENWSQHSLSLCPSVWLSLYGSTVLLLDFARFSFSCSYTQSVGLLGRGSAGCKAATYTQNNTKQMHAIQTSMPWVGFEPKIPAFERANTVHAANNTACKSFLLIR
jgi:hypothetical protein